VLVKHSDHGALLDALDSLRATEDAAASVLQMAWKSANRRQTAVVEVVLQGLWLNGQYAGAVGVARDLLLRGEYLDQRLTSERVSAIVELAVATAHRINNPLAILSMQVGVMEQTLQDGRPVPQEMLDQMRHVIGRITDVVKDLAAVADTSVRKGLRGRAMMDLGGWAELAEADDDM
jgi:signal transduction histidine kinase